MPCQHPAAGEDVPADHYPDPGPSICSADCISACARPTGTTGQLIEQDAHPRREDVWYAIKALLPATLALMAALRFGQLAEAMTTAGNKAVDKLFRRLADDSLRHLGEAKARAGFRPLPEIAPGDFRWPDIQSPKAAAIWAAAPFLGIVEGVGGFCVPLSSDHDTADLACALALQVALDAETAGLNFYAGMLKNTQDPEIQLLAREFVEEESQHVTKLKRWMEMHRSGQPLPTAA